MEEKVFVKVLFFGKARELVKTPSQEIGFGKGQFLSTEKIVSILESKFPELEHLRGCYVLALNEDYLATTANISLASGKSLRTFFNVKTCLHWRKITLN